MTNKSDYSYSNVLEILKQKDDKRILGMVSKFITNRKIIKDFYNLVPEGKFDFKMTENSDSIRYGLAHILEVHLMYLNGYTSGELEFKDMGVEHYFKMSKNELLSEMDKIENNMFEIFLSKDFDINKIINTPWGKRDALSMFYAMIDHEIFHEGWNLALMDHLNIERFDSLKELWG